MEEGGSGLLEGGVWKVGSDFREWGQDEAAEVKPGVGNAESRHI